MRKAIFSIIILSLIIILPTAAETKPFAVPPLPEDEVRDSKIYYKEGDVVLEDMVTVQRMLYLEAPSLLKHHVYWVGEGDSRHPEVTLIEERHNETTATYTFFFRPGKDFIMEGFSKVVTNKDGNEIRREYYNTTNPLIG
ncbi:MAG: hypothetical protein JSU92_02870, partial [Deltaproteobacteria bacterium]